MDKARQQTDKILHTVECDIGRIYATNPALLRIKKKYMKYMEYVSKATRMEYKAYLDETDINVKAEKKKVYMDKLETLTSKSKEYNDIIKQFVKQLAEVNQQALDVVNASMTEIYMINYNQVATECRKAGIKVNGKENKE